MSHNFERTQAIIEELRADIDFELDDVLVKIVNGLPEGYFRSFSNHDLLKPLKALLALGICQLDEEIQLTSDGGRQLTVVANRNYPGQLAAILKRLPDEPALMGARVFTSKAHDFIIDLFEFKQQASTDQPAISSIAIAQLIEDVASITNQSTDSIAEFVSHYDRHNRILKYPNQVAEHFLAFNEIEHSRDVVVRCKLDTQCKPGTQTKLTQITVSLGSATGKEVFQRSAEFLGNQKLDIERAWLHDLFPLDANSHVAIASFLVDSSARSELDFDALSKELEQFIG